MSVNWHIMRPKVRPRPQPRPVRTGAIAPVSETNAEYYAQPSRPFLPPATPPATRHQFLLEPSKKRPGRSRRIAQRVRSVFRSLPVFTPACHLLPHRQGHIHGGVRMTGTVFGRRKARVSIAIQENPSSLPVLLLELPLSTNKLLHEMRSGLVRVALETEKKPGHKLRLTDEPLWTVYFNGRRTGSSATREPNAVDISVLHLLHAVSVGAGVVPAGDDDPPDEDLAYMRAHFERVAVSNDSETYYMLNPDGNDATELTLFFIRV